ncbi:MAG TPA: M20/M25/M40 family metallo-hydrolase [Gemmatimonadaceae bacterium]|nr:M20/M25/M40 family metallo-hydrolase [Gemmatimonadaceae bacterium]
MQSSLARQVLVSFAALAMPAVASAQAAIPVDNPSMRRALDGIKAWNAWTLEQQVSICEIPAPSFKEQARGAEFRKRLIALGYPNTRIDVVGNVIAERAGSGNGPTVMIAGHLDTVFPEGTNVKVRREADKFTAPGISDDCRGLAVVLAVARALNENRVTTTGKIILVGDVGEEGSGNLRGVRQLFTGEYKGKVDYFISVEGLGLHVTDRAVGSKRYSVKFTGPGGHSYGAFGMPSAIHAMGRAIAGISDVQVPATPKTTFNVGVVSGGTSVNSIAGEAAMEVDMRSESWDSLEQVEAAIRQAVETGLAAENARWPRSPARITGRYDTIGIRPLPAKPQTDESPIVRTALDAAKALGERVPTGAGSTDSNLPMSFGVPAITIGGGGKGEGAHALTEWYQDGPDGYKGPQWALLIVAALSGMSASVTP